MADEDAQIVQDAFTEAASNLPPLVLPSEATRPYDLSVDAVTLDTDLSLLASLLHSHETARTQQSVRTAGRPDTMNEPPSKRKQSIQQALATELTRAIREGEDRPIGSGVERNVRWRVQSEGSDASKGTVGDGSGALTARGVATATPESTGQLEGNALNAAMVAGAKAVAVCA